MSQHWRDTDQGEIFAHFGHALQELHAKADRAFRRIYQVDEYRSGQLSGRA